MNSAMPVMENEQYCAQQINVPPTFPFVLKQYAKAAIKTQPYDLVQWSAAYFRALAHGEVPPAKDRLEFPPLQTPSGLTPGYLHVLIKQLGKEGTVSVEQLREKWLAICLKEEGLYQMLTVGQFGHTLDWLCFIGVAAGFLTNSLEETMVLVCELLTEEPPGGSASISLTVFSKVYSYLAALDCGVPKARRAAGNTKNSQSNEMKEMWGADTTSVSTAAASSDSARQLYMAVSSPSNSPQLSRVPSELDTSLPAGARVGRSGTGSATTLTEQSEDDDTAMLQTFYDNTDTVRDSPHSSEEAILEGEGNKTHAAEEVGEDSSDEKETCRPMSNSSAPEIKTNASPTAMHIEPVRAKSTDVTGSERVLKQSASLKEINVEADLRGNGSAGKSMVFCVPGIGAVVEPSHVATVLSYLADVAADQSGMITASDFCHVMCPPLEGQVISSSPESFDAVVSRSPLHQSQHNTDP